MRRAIACLYPYVRVCACLHAHYVKCCVGIFGSIDNKVGSDGGFFLTQRCRY